MVTEAVEGRPDAGVCGTSVADRVRVIWADVLADRLDEEIEPDQGFLDAGGHSLAAARLIARLRGDLAVELPMSAILRDDPTLAQLVEVVTSLINGAGGAPTPSPATPAAVGSPTAGSGSPTAESAPLAPALRRIWAWHRLHPDSPAYNVVRVLSLRGRMQPAALRAALTDLSERHEALRCAVAEPQPGRPEIVVPDRISVPLSVEVVRSADHDPDSAIDEALYRIADKLLPMASAPMWRVGVVYAPAPDRTYLILVMHHLISDLRTTNLVLDDLAEAYQARLGGAAPTFATPAPSLLHHLEFEAALAGTPRWREDLDWWSGQLAGVSSAVPLPLSAADRSEAVYAATTHSSALTADESNALDAVLRAHRLTPGLFFLTSASAVLVAWDGHRRTEVVGVPSARVSRPQDERLAGFLLDTLPLPVTPNRECSFLRGYEAVRDAYAAAADHGLPPFDEVVERLRLPRTARSPLIRLWFNDLTQTVVPAAFGADAAEYDLPPAWSLFDLGLYLRRSPAGYRLHLVSPRGLCDPDDTAALLSQIVRTATRAAADPARALGELLEAPLSGDARPASAPVADSTSDRLRLHARERPDAVAVSDGTNSLDYRSLEAAVEAAAAQLRSAAGPGAVIALPARRDRHFVVRLLACWRVGVTAVLVDAAWPEWRRSRAFQITDAAWAYPWSSDGPAEPAAAADSPVRLAGGLAHVLFTSGTTGDPLAVRVSTPVAEAALEDLGALLEVGPGDRLAMLSSPAHDPMLREVGLAIRVGATICVPPPAIIGKPHRIGAWLRAERVSVVSATPALLALVCGADTEPLLDVRVVVCGGSPLSVATAELIRSSAPHAVVVNGYGCTETPQLVIAHSMPPDPPVPATAEVPIGKPLPGRLIDVRGADGRRCDTGQLGELWVGAPHLAEEYLGDAGIDRFVTDSSGQRWLRTGDLARRDANGRLHLAGRSDRQVLVNGHRVMLEEIESLARRCTGVTDAVAHLAGDEGLQVIRVWVQRAPDADLGAEDLRAYLATMLPTGVVPPRVMVVDRLNLGDTFKPTAPAWDPVVAADGSPAADARLRQLAESVLDGPLEPGANFFDAGFTSTSILQLSAELCDVFGRPVDALSLFRYPNLRALSAFLFGSPADPSAPESGPPSAVADRADRLARMGDRRRQVRTWIRESSDIHL
jgi:non-ribosomal peptide synthetase component F/acyl carrier protein